MDILDHTIMIVLKLWATKIAKERQELLSRNKMNVLAYQYPAKLLQTSPVVNTRHNTRSQTDKKDSNTESKNRMKILVQFRQSHVVLHNKPHSLPSEIIKATLGRLHYERFT